jgi:membrane-associated phospholipid phosphatase
MTAAAWRDVRSVRLPMSIWQGVVILSAIPIGGHYLVDLLAGSLCWAFVYFLWRFVLDREWLREGQLPLADTRYGIAIPPFTCSVCPVTYPASLEAR